MSEQAEKALEIRKLRMKKFDYVLDTDFELKKR